MTPTDRFWSKVDRSGECWVWLAQLHEAGYGMFWVTGRTNADGSPNRSMVRAHRFAYELENGAIPPGLFVCHHCDNRRCVRASHLFVGTNLDNVRDMDRKGRRVYVPPRVINRPSAKLTEGQVLAIREKRASGVMLSELAAEYGVAKSTVCLAAKGRNWRGISTVPMDIA